MKHHIIECASKLTNHADAIVAGVKYIDIHGTLFCSAKCMLAYHQEACGETLSINAYCMYSTSSNLTISYETYVK